MGSVKDLEIIKKPSPDTLGIGRFIFSNRYSVFDWGEMPDHIDHKGEALALAAACFFEELENRGIKTHYKGLVEKGETKKLSDIDEPVNTMEIKLLRVIEPTYMDGRYDYSGYLKERNVLIPLEVIYRNSLPEGSSVFRRLKSGDLKLEDIGLKDFPLPGQKLTVPLVDFSTKLETTDRYLSRDEAMRISGLGREEMVELKKIVNSANSLITEGVSRMSLMNEDGKFEFGFDPDRQFMLIDVIGTLDECRFTFRGLPVSKELARIYYRRTRWYDDVNRTKRENGRRWKEFCSSPPPLPPQLKVSISEVYQSFANEMTRRNWFDVPSLKEILAGLRQENERD